MAAQVNQHQALVPERARGDESIMKPKSHGKPLPPTNLRLPPAICTILLELKIFMLFHVLFSTGTCDRPVQENLLYGCDNKTADGVCCFNRHYAEHRFVMQ